jgi:hypothetical protein
MVARTEAETALVLARLMAWLSPRGIAGSPRRACCAYVPVVTSSLRTEVGWRHRDRLEPSLGDPATVLAELPDNDRRQHPPACDRRLDGARGPRDNHGDVGQPARSTSGVMQRVPSAITPLTAVAEPVDDTGWAPIRPARQ